MKHVLPVLLSFRVIDPVSAFHGSKLAAQNCGSISSESNPKDCFKYLSQGEKESIVLAKQSALEYGLWQPSISVPV